MHHVVVERWSRGSSPLHSRDARAKLGALLVFLIAVATTPVTGQAAFAAYAMLLVAGILVARLPPAGLIARVSLILPFAAIFAAVSWLAGDTARAAVLIEKSFLSGLAVLLLVATTPLDRLAAGIESLGVPRLLPLVVQFLYRYLFVISEQAQHMRLAAQCRGGLGRRVGFRAAAGALSVLFARSYERADGIHRAMLARGFTGHFSLLAPPRFGTADAAFLVAAAAAPLAARLAL